MKLRSGRITQQGAIGVMAQPAQPAAAPAQPRPLLPAQPVQPAAQIPAQPVIPIQPIQPAQPVQPVQPVQPAQPILPALPVPPALPVLPLPAAPAPIIPAAPALPIPPQLPPAVDATLREAVKVSLPDKLSQWPRPVQLLRWLQHLRSAINFGLALPEPWKVAQIISVLPDRHGLPLDFTMITAAQLMDIVQRDHCPAHPTTIVWSAYLTEFSKRPPSMSILEYILEIGQIARDMHSFGAGMSDEVVLAMFNSGVDYRPVSSYLAQHNPASLADVHTLLMATDLYAVRPGHPTGRPSPHAHVALRFTSRRRTYLSASPSS